MELNEDFRIAVVGRNSVGKTSFLNQLLWNNEQMPVDRKPNTYIYLNIRYSDETNLIFDKKIIFDNIKNNLKELNEKYKNQEQKSEIVLNVKYKYPELKNICFIDTPGFKDQNKTKKTFELCKTVNLVIFLINIDNDENKEDYEEIYKYNKNILVLLVEKNEWDLKEEPEIYVKNELKLQNTDNIFYVLKKDYSLINLVLIQQSEIVLKEVAKKNYNLIKDRLYELAPPDYTLTKKIKTSKIKTIVVSVAMVLGIILTFAIPVIGIGVGLFTLSLTIDILITSNALNILFRTEKFKGYDKTNEEIYFTYYEKNKLYENEEIYDSGKKLRYKGSILDGKIHGQGEIYDDKGDLMFCINCFEGKVLSFQYFDNLELICTEKKYYAVKWEMELN